METNRYKNDLEIDADSLDREFIQQPQLYMKYAEEFARADMAQKKAKERIDILRSEIIRDIVSTAGKKPADTILEAEIMADKEYREQYELFLEKKYEADVLASAVKAFDHKKSALENLARLWVGGYYSTPKQTKDTEQTKNDSRSQRQRKRLNKE
jgi:hypothetical protein